VVISDVTRPVPNKLILPPLLKTLEESGIKKHDITLLIATGMHRPNLGEELEPMVGRPIMEQYNIVNHYCHRSEEYRRVDEIDGAPIEINTHYLDADLKILTGLIEPHFYAGYSGGRKSILPGISSFETMKFMHSYKMIDHPMVTNCVLDGNPFHEYGLRVTELVGADFILNVVINKERKISGVFAGHFNHAHLAGCDLVYRHSAVPVDGLADLVITSGGGYPLDATFYQISKSLICAKNILKPGGTIVVACECREGLGSLEFCGIMRSVCTPAEFFEGYCEPENFVIDQWCAQNIYQVLDHAGRVYIYSPGLSYEDVMKMGAIKVEDLQSTVTRLLDGHEKAVAVPDGPYVVGMVKKDA
jgi:nickel-dependent lactate racemase